MNTIRPSQRQPDELRTLEFTHRFTRYAEGSVLVAMGQTQVLCTASIIDTVPLFLKGKGRGWITAEYGMLPRSTHNRTEREAALGKQRGRSLEIQRLIGRALRATLDLTLLGERTIILDCDVIQADGGTRTASINGAWLALHDAISSLLTNSILDTDPRHTGVAAVSVGVYQGVPILDLDYAEDSGADTDMNVVMNAHGHFIELQGTAEKVAFPRNTLNTLLDLASYGITQIMDKQRICLKSNIQL